MTKRLLKGYLIDEVDDLAKEVIQLFAEVDTPTDLGILALCRAIVMLGTPEDLDVACRVIDELSEVPFDTTSIGEEFN